MEILYREERRDEGLIVNADLVAHYGFPGHSYDTENLASEKKPELEALIAKAMSVFDPEYACVAGLLLAFKDFDPKKLLDRLENDDARLVLRLAVGCAKIGMDLYKKRCARGDTQEMLLNEAYKGTQGATMSKEFWEFTHPIPEATPVHCALSILTGVECGVSLYAILDYWLEIAANDPLMKDSYRFCIENSTQRLYL